MNKYSVYFQVRANHFGNIILDQDIEVFAENAEVAKIKVEKFVIDNAREVDSNAQYFFKGLYPLKTFK